MREKYQAAGVQFIKTHYKYLMGAQARFGVLPQDIVAILTWESGLGIWVGEYRVFNVMMGQVFFMDRAQRYAVAEMVKQGKPNPLDDPGRMDKEARRLQRRKKTPLQVSSLFFAWPRKCRLIHSRSRVRGEERSDTRSSSRTISSTRWMRTGMGLISQLAGCHIQRCELSQGARELREIAGAEAKGVPPLQCKPGVRRRGNAPCRHDLETLPAEFLRDGSR